MSSENETQADFFDWAESFTASSEVRDTEWHESLSPLAKQVLELATQAALSLKHDAVGAEHLLAGLLKLNYGRGTEALRRAGLTLPSLREEIESERGIRGQQDGKRPIPYTPRCKGIIQRAQASVRSLDNASVEVEDLLLELLAENDGLPAQIFRKRKIRRKPIDRVSQPSPGRVVQRHFPIKPRHQVFRLHEG
jgi:ATP-dependent Clp protease ATP-binding subunit ClpC